MDWVRLFSAVSGAAALATASWIIITSWLRRRRLTSEARRIEDEASIRETSIW
jgi:hypothetical protein